MKSKDDINALYYHLKDCHSTLEWKAKMLLMLYTITSKTVILPWNEKQKCYWCSIPSPQRLSFYLGMKSKNAMDALNHHLKDCYSTLDWKGRMLWMLYAITSKALIKPWIEKQECYRCSMQSPQTVIQLWIEKQECYNCFKDKSTENALLERHSLLGIMG
jgi:hypothetical protein